MTIKKHIPNLLTCCNLACGCLGLLAVWQGNYHHSAYYIIIAAIFDFLDGFAARLLHVQSSIGKELDSLADMVTFGVLPGFVLFALLANISPWYWLPYLGFATVIFSAIRLAKFNVDTRQTEQFIGLPTPANALFISGLALIIAQSESSFLYPFVSSLYVLISIAVVFPLLLVAELPLLALKFKSFGWQGNEYRWVLIVCAIALLVIVQIQAIPLVILLYIALSVVQQQTSRLHKG